MFDARFTWCVFHNDGNDDEEASYIHPKESDDDGHSCFSYEPLPIKYDGDDTGNHDCSTIPVITTPIRMMATQQTPERQGVKPLTLSPTSKVLRRRTRCQRPTARSAPAALTTTRIKTIFMMTTPRH
jgi:hypothetical protein